ncbi:mitotic-spindle organizing protein 1-like [Diabrotica virgifera virgifera]|uniref:Mitotic-spindle organizing protein 1-like n=1 Tax=Diabrotica virgifera virgifera TaxID=50390 RepID=A0A6P7GPX0_DIAVI|nr:mitotic-spindle organizing protein 1-like [Diabrotica virgifera virgifera]
MKNRNVSTIKEAKETFQSLLELSRLLCTGLEPETLAICVRLCESGVNPELLAKVIKELKSEIQSATGETMDET